ncbi:transposase [Methylocystis sp. SC2]|uniref:transposase n=1 Tax=Methylocystis sp. (strain SC2) TaxID=187303 RepID=UPI00027AEF25|nr:transposase [Methylocystis sp. SC2]CCJ07019.1 Putative transposase [Methylocystis sp. SC2]
MSALHIEGASARVDVARAATEDQLIENYLSDEHWQAVAPVLPGKQGDPGCRGRDNRLFLEAVFWIFRTGSPWRSLPPQFGKWYTAYTRYHRWDRKHVWPRVVAALSDNGKCDFQYDKYGLRFAPRDDIGAPEHARNDADGHPRAAVGELVGV